MDSETFISTFWARVKPGSGCWEWTGPKDAKGYGRHGHFKAHRIAYELSVGPIPTGLVLDHLCRNPGCVRPQHVEPVTPAENTRRGKPRREYAARVEADRAAAKLGCPECGEPLTKVTDSRPVEDAVRRRRECPNGHRATTFEYVAAALSRLLGAA